MKRIIVVFTLILASSFLKAQELNKVYYDNGELQAEGKIENGKEVGLWKIYYENGTLAQTGNFDNGLRIGEWKFYYDNGQLQTEGKVENGKEVGLWKIYHENGTLAETGNFDNGIRIGEWKFYHDNGQLQAEGKVENGKEVGLWKIYYENGTLAQTGNFDNGIIIGEWKFYHDDGQLSKEAHFTNGTQTGEWKEYYENGKLSKTGNYDEKGKKNGDWNYYSYDNGYFLTETYIDGEYNIYESAKNTFKNLTIDMIKEDLLGKRLYRKNFKSLTDYMWVFEDLSEFIDLNIISSSMSAEEDEDEYTTVLTWYVEANLLLKDASGKRLVEKAKLTYSFTGYGRKLTLIEAEKMEKTQLERL